MKEDDYKTRPQLIEEARRIKENQQSPEIITGWKAVLLTILGFAMPIVIAMLGVAIINEWIPLTHIITRLIVGGSIVIYGICSFFKVFPFIFN